MLYQTHHPFYFPCSASSSSKFFSLSLPSSTAAFSTTTASFQVDKEMECMMKGGFRPEMMVGFGPKQVISQDYCNFNSPNASSVSVSVSIPGEDLFVDQLLNLSDEDATAEEDKDKETGLLVVVKEEPLEVATKPEAPCTDNVSAFPSPPLETERTRDDFGSVLSVPAEEGDLEWLSHFVEESFSQFSNPYPEGLGPISVQPKPSPETSQTPYFGPPPALSKSRRSKRVRTGGRVWSTPLTDSSSVSSPSSPSINTTSSSPPCSPNPDSNPPKRQKKRTGGPGGGPPRRCSHCGVQKTPQWRTGPQGAKTLCNACGVRFKSGRLLPEYRPACSPTFSSDLHSNNHRKVLEMRKKKELVMAGRPEPNLPHPVPSFG